MGFVFRLLLPTGLMASLVLLLILATRPLLRLATARQRRLAVLVAAVLFLLPLPAAIGGIGQAFASQGLEQTLVQAVPTAPLYAVGEVIGGALEAQPAPADTTPAAEEEKPPAAQPEKAAAPASIKARLDAMVPLALPALTLLYFLGLAVSLGLFAIRYGLFWRRLRQGASQPVSPALQRLYEQLAEELGIQRPPVLRVREDVSSPILAGIRRPVILLPTAMQTDLDAAGYALRHELTHHRHGDVPFKLAVQLVVAIHWFNPLCYLLRREAGEICEQACDEAVAERLDSLGRKAYALALLECAGGAIPYAAAGFASPARRLKKRLGNLLHPAKCRRGTKPLLACALALVLCVGILAGCALQAGTQSVVASLPGEPEDASASVMPVTALDDPDQIEDSPEPEAEALPRYDGLLYHTFQPGEDGEYAYSNTQITYYTESEGEPHLTGGFPPFEPGRALHVLEAPSRARDGADYTEFYMARLKDGGVVYELAPLHSSFETLTSPYITPFVDGDAYSAANTGTVLAVGEVYGSGYLTVQTESGCDIYLPTGEPSVQPGDEVLALAPLGEATDGTRVLSCAVPQEDMVWLYGEPAFLQSYLAPLFAQKDTYSDETGEDYTEKEEMAGWELALDTNTAYVFPLENYNHLGRGFSGSSHRGFDILADQGEPIYSIAAGEVVESGFHYSWGNTVVVDAEGVTFRYAHCEELAVEVGQAVDQGQLLATVGASGYSTSYQLHLEMAVDGTLVDPREYVTPPGTYPLQG